MDDLLTPYIMEELLDEYEATPEEREKVKEVVVRTGNPWDTVVILQIIRAAAK